MPSPINPAIPARQDELAALFRPRDPFRHVVIENFFRDEYAQQILV